MKIETFRLSSVVLTVQFANLLTIRTNRTCLHSLNFKFVSFCSFSLITIIKNVTYYANSLSKNKTARCFGYKPKQRAVNMRCFDGSSIIYRGGR